VSAGDFFSVLFKHDPYVKLFGKSTAGAFGAYGSLTSPYPGFLLSKQLVDFFQVNAPTSYLSHTYFPIDFPVWFDKDSVCAGVDNIVSNAVTWIDQNISDLKTVKQGSVRLFPNPANDFVNIDVQGAAPETFYITLTDLIGQTLRTQQFIVNSQNTTTSLNLKGLTPGMYFVTVKNGDGQKVFKLMKL
jgi:hypothetical protein